MKNNELVQLIKSAKQGKQKAITELYNKTKDYAYRVARQYVPEPDIADAVQEAYISVFRTLATFDDTKEFTPWLHTIVKHKCIDLLKRNNKQSFVSDDMADSFEDTEPLPTVLLENKQKRSDILTIINGLTVGQRTAVILYYLEGMSIKEISDELGVTEGTVKKQLHIAKQAIKEAVLLEESEHDNKLYGIGAIPFLTELLTSEVEQGAYVMPQALSAEVFGGVMNGIATSGVVAGSSLGGLMAMTVGGKAAVAAVTALAIISTAGAGYLYIEKENAAEQTIEVMAQVEQLKEQIVQQGEIIKTLEAEDTNTSNGGTGYAPALPGVNNEDDSSLPGITDNNPWLVAPDGSAVKNPNYNPDVPIDTPLPGDMVPGDMVPPASKPETPASKPETTASKPETHASKPKPPVDNGNTQLSPEEIDRIMKEQGINGVGVSGTITNPNDEGLLKPNGE